MFDLRNCGVSRIMCIRYKMGSLARAMRRGGLAVIYSDHHALPTDPFTHRSSSVQDGIYALHPVSQTFP